MSHLHGCGCDCEFDRREFLSAAGLAAGGLLYTTALDAGESPATQPAARTLAVVRVVFLYPPSKQFAGDPEGWWSWPGNDFDAEGRQKQYIAALRGMEKKLGMSLVIDERPVAANDDAQRLAQKLEASKPDGLLMVMFFNRSRPQADILIKAAQTLKIPAIFYVGLGVMHGPVQAYRRQAGLHFIQSLDNMEAIESGLRMIHAKKRMGQARLLSITEAKEPREGKEAFFGTTVRVIPFARYAEIFKQVEIDAPARAWAEGYARNARENRGVAQDALDNATRAYLALRRLLVEENADGLTMNCLRRGMLKPCLAFASLNSQLIPATCENDFPAMYGQLLGQLLTGRAGFQHNPCFDTERNHYYAFHCTCPTRPYGPEGSELPYLLRRFAHTNEGSCAIQVFWNPGDPVTMIHYYPGKPPRLDVYAGKVCKSHPMPPAGGCTTNVEIEIADRPDACMVQGHHNILFCGDYARQFKAFANLYGIPVIGSAEKAPPPGETTDA